MEHHYPLDAIVATTSQIYERDDGDGDGDVTRETDSSAIFFGAAETLENARGNGRQFMFTRRKIFLPVNHPVNLYETRGSDSLPRVCVNARPRLGYIAFTSARSHWVVFISRLSSPVTLRAVSGFIHSRPFASRRANDSTRSNVTAPR